MIHNEKRFHPTVNKFARVSIFLVLLVIGLDFTRAQTINCSPESIYIEVDTSSNRLYLKCEEEILLKAVCSTGSGHELTDGDRTWKFETPKGRFRIRGILENPLWRRPDWAFLEEGLNIPKKESERFLANALGKYALNIGNGYFIHGTLYERLLGQSVTHGCIRLGTKDLKQVAQIVQVGTPVLIF